MIWRSTLSDSSSRPSTARTVLTTSLMSTSTSSPDDAAEFADAGRDRAEAGHEVKALVRDFERFDRDVALRRVQGRSGVLGRQAAREEPHEGGRLRFVHQHDGAVAPLPLPDHEAVEPVPEIGV